MKTYMIKVNTIDNLYADYMVEAENLFFAKMQTRNAFFRDYPEANKHIKLSLSKPDTETITEIMKVINSENN
jgi:hypothetical protein